MESATPKLITLKCFLESLHEVLDDLKKLHRHIRDLLDSKGYEKVTKSQTNSDTRFFAQSGYFDVKNRSDPYKD